MSNYGPSARYYMGLAEKARAAAVPELPPAFSEFLGNLSDMMMLDGASASGAATEPGGGAAAVEQLSMRMAKLLLNLKFPLMTQLNLARLLAFMSMI